MNFPFTDEQDELRQRVRHAFAGGCSVDALRQFHLALPEERATMAATRWRALSDLGVPKLLVPVACGGVGLNNVHLVGILEEAGWCALPEPLLETSGLAAPMLAALLPAASAADALGVLLDGNAPLAVGGIDVGATGPTSPTTVSADGMLRTPGVVGARDASIFLLACRDPDSGWQLHAVPATVCTVHATSVLDTARDLSTVHWPLSSDTLLAYGVAAEASVGVLADRGAAGAAALLVGLADRMITMAADYAEECQQFGQSIARSHTVRDLLINARVTLEMARPVAYRAAWSLATAQPLVTRDASMAKAMASDAADLAARVALQVHGAIGTTWESDLHLFMKRAWSLSKAWGDATTHRQIVLAQRRRPVHLGH